MAQREDRAPGPGPMGNKVGPHTPRNRPCSLPLTRLQQNPEKGLGWGLRVHLRAKADCTAVPFTDVTARLSHLTPLCLQVPICEMGVMTAPTSDGDHEGSGG